MPLRGDLDDGVRHRTAPVGRPDPWPPLSLHHRTTRGNPPPNPVIARKPCDAAIRPPNPVIARSEATWQSLGSIVQPKFPAHRCHEIATAPSGPRNDRCGRWSAPGLRFPLSLRGGRRPTWQSGNLLAPTGGQRPPLRLFFLCFFISVIESPGKVWYDYVD